MNLLQLVPPLLLLEVVVLGRVKYFFLCLIPFLLIFLIACRSAINENNRLAFVINESYTDCETTELEMDLSGN